MLQPMHSRISSTRPSSILRGRNGSAIDGRAAPIRSHTPLRTISAIRSGSVSRPDADDRLGGRLAHARRALELPALGEEARRPGVERPLGDRADGDVPEVDEVVGQAHELEALLEVDAERAHAVDGDPAGDRAVVADRRAHRLERLEPEARAVGERAAVLVACAGCRPARGTAPAGRCARRRRRRCRTRPRASARPRAPSRPARGGCRASSWPAARGPVAKSLAICEGAAAGRRDSLFSPCAPVCESSMPASAPCRCASSQVAASTREVAVVPHARRDVRRLVGLRVDRAVLGVDRGPAALGLDGAVARLRPRLLDAESGAVRHLVEAVAERLRPDPHGLEEDVVTRVATHAGSMQMRPRTRAQVMAAPGARRRRARTPPRERIGPRQPRPVGMTSRADDVRDAEPADREVAASAPCPVSVWQPPHECAKMRAHGGCPSRVRAAAPRRRAPRARPRRAGRAAPDAGVPSECGRRPCASRSRTPRRRSGPRATAPCRRPRRRPCRGCRRPGCATWR